MILEGALGLPIQQTQEHQAAIILNGIALQLGDRSAAHEMAQAIGELHVLLCLRQIGLGRGLLARHDFHRHVLPAKAHLFLGLGEHLGRRAHESIDPTIDLIESLKLAALARIKPWLP